MTMAPAPSSVVSGGDIVQSVLIVVLVVFVTAVLTIAIRLVLRSRLRRSGEHESTGRASRSAIHADGVEIGSDLRAFRASRSRSSIHAAGKSFRVEIGFEIQTSRASRSRSTIHAAGDGFPVEIGPDVPVSFEIGSDLPDSSEIGSDLPDSFEIGSDLQPQSDIFEIHFLPIPSAPLEPEVDGGSGRLSCASSLYHSFRSSGRFFTGSSRRREIHGLEEEIAEYMDLQW